MVILIQCIDRVGLVASIAKVLEQKNVNINSMREHVDMDANRFFARLSTEHHTEADMLLPLLRTVLPDDAIIHVNPEPDKKIILLVTKEHHCLSDILVRDHFKTLGASVQCVIGNHDTLKNICDRFDVPFFNITHENKTKEAFESEMNDGYLLSASDNGSQIRVKEFA